MQYKKNIKIIIDKRKLDLLLRLNCPKEILFDAVINNKITKVGDELIDDTLESLIDIKEFNNWGGKREGSGRKNHLENQVENHLENQEPNQVVDKDIDIDIDIEEENKNISNKQIYTLSNININKKNKKLDPYINPIKKFFEEEYKKVFGQKPYLGNISCNKLVEIAAEDSNIREHIPIAIESLKKIDFKDINFTPSASWLLKDNNFERVLNGEFKNKKEEIDGWDL